MRQYEYGATRWQVALLLLLASAGTASAKACPQSKASGVAVVTGAGRAYFHYDAALCPNHQAYCLERAYVITGDRVLTGGSQDGYTCVFAPGNNTITSGWIETARLRSEAINSSPPSSAWEGVWESEGIMRIKVGRNKSALQASGVADWHTGDGTDDRGKTLLPGQVHHAQFSGQLRASGNHARLEDGDCAVDLTLLNAFLIVDDDASCGDGNTSLSGIYRHKR